MEKSYLGKGRSGVVFKETSPEGVVLATKIFAADDSLANLVNFIFYGSPNAYRWNEDAVLCAHYRRKLLEKLLPFWFNGKLRIATSHGISWNQELISFEIKTEYIDGKHAGLHHPFSNQQEWEIKDLVNNVSIPLQKKLEESGFDGLVWQAGRGNPTATSNFMLKDNVWVWIDAESGVPALFPLNPIDLFSFYIPKTFQYRKPMFDDVDVIKLKSYLVASKTQLEDYLGASGYSELQHHLSKLEIHQEKWKRMTRIRKGVMARLQLGKINQNQADFFIRYPYLWVVSELSRALFLTLRLLFYSLPIRVYKKITSFDYVIFFKNAFGFVFSNKKRKKIVEDYMFDRIDQWIKRKHMSDRHANILKGQLAHEATTPYFTDFMVVLGLKPIMNVIEIFGFPTLYAFGFINEVMLAFALTFGGAIYRTLYTISRMLFERLKPPSARLPRTIALFAGLIPTIGNASYAFQMIFAATKESKELAEFILYDMSSIIGHKIPIWGGKDTQTEHFFNRLPDLIIRKREYLPDSLIPDHTSLI